MITPSTTTATSTQQLTMKQLDEEADLLPPGAEDLLVYDKFQGSRTPVTDALARGAFLGISSINSSTS